MKNFFKKTKNIILSFASIIISLSGCNNSDKVTHLTNTQISAIQFLASEIHEYYSFYDTCDYTEFPNMSVFEYTSSETGYLFFAQAKSTRTFGYDTFTLIYTDGYLSRPYVSILTAGNSENGSPKALELYNSYKKLSGKIQYVDTKLSNDCLQETLNSLFKNGMNGYKSDGDVTPITHVDYEYMVENGTVAITKYIGNDRENVIIPDQIEGKNVTRIKTNAFINERVYEYDYDDNQWKWVLKYGDIKYLTLPRTIEVIEEFSFNDYEYLHDNGHHERQIDRSAHIEYVFIPPSIRYISYDAFQHSTKLLFESDFCCNVGVSYMNMPQSQTVFFDNLLFGKYRDGPLGAEAVVIDCPNDAKKINIPAVVKIGEQTMTVVKLGDNAFSRCNKLESLELPQTLEDINFDAFDLYGKFWKEDIEKDFKEVFPLLKLNEYRNGLYLPSAANPYYCFICRKNVEESFVFHDNTVRYNYHSFESGYSSDQLGLLDCVEYDGIYYLPSASNPYFFAVGLDYKYDFKNDIVSINAKTKIMLLDGFCIERKPLFVNIPASVIYIRLVDPDAGYVQVNSYYVNSGNDYYKSDNGSLFDQGGLGLFVLSETSCDENGKYRVPSYVYYIRKGFAARHNYLRELVLSNNTLEIETDAFPFCNLKKVNLNKYIKKIDGLYYYNYGTFICSIVAPYGLDNYNFDKNRITSKDGKTLFCIFRDEENTEGSSIYNVPSSVINVKEGALNYPPKGTEMIFVHKNVKTFGYNYPHQQYSVQAEIVFEDTSMVHY